VHAAGGRGTLEQCVVSGGIDPKLLEINEAGNLTPWLSRLPRHILARYPECDITRLPYPDGAFDLVVHSDTLEHVTDPDQGLRECRRVLSPGGACAFTVPVVVGRLTRDRHGLPASYHGRPECRDDDFRVHTEFGADVWTTVFKAGFSRCELVPFRFPSGLAIVAWR
jgi:SAM-dependent methyltransferase